MKSAQNCVLCSPRCSSRRPRAIRQVSVYVRERRTYIHTNTLCFASVAGFNAQKCHTLTLLVFPCYALWGVNHRQWSPLRNLPQAFSLCVILLLCPLLGEIKRDITRTKERGIQHQHYHHHKHKPTINRYAPAEETAQSYLLSDRCRIPHTHPFNTKCKTNRKLAAITKRLRKSSSSWGNKS